MSPTDQDCYFGPPELFMPEYDEVHISTVFTWDIERAVWLADQWRLHCDKVEVDGPAFGDPGGEFVPGKYVKPGVTITSRGCPNRCSFCFVPKREGKIRELPIHAGNIVQDNNLLACSDRHIDGVFAMLKGQKQIDFTGGLESGRVTDALVERLRGLSIYQLWLAYDYPGQSTLLARATAKLGKYFYRNQIRCYVLIGYERDTIEAAEARLMTAWDAGTLPFAMLYRDEENTEPTKEWQNFTRTWLRPAATKARAAEIKGGR